MMTLVLLITCVETPYSIAFASNELEIDVLSLLIDLFFFFDILIIFNTAYYDEEMEIIADRETIGKSYLSGWFTIDFIAIVPFDIIMNAA